MGTRGLTGFVVDGQEKLGYQQYDSYPEGVGVEVLTYLRMVMETKGVESLRKKARDLKLVSDAVPPTQEDIARLGKYTDLKVGAQSTSDWYCLTRETHGKLDLILDCGYIEDQSSFASDSLFCEWAYVVDLDEGVLEVYCGFQTKPHTAGRFANRKVVERESSGDKYYPITLLHTWPLDKLPDETTFVETLAEAAERHVREQEG